MNLQIMTTPATLASPSIAAENLQPQLAVGLGIEPQLPTVLRIVVHEFSPFTA
jgi:hypothetical protein